MTFCTACGAQLEADANFCAICGAHVGGGPAGIAATNPTEAANPPPARVPPETESSPYGGLFGKRHRDKDFRAKVEQALADDILTQTEETQLLAWAEAQGVTPKDWRNHFADLLDRMLIAGVNDGRIPDITAEAHMMLKTGETVHYQTAAALMKEVTLREFRGGSRGVSIPIVKGVRYRTGSFRGRSVVVGTQLQAADQGTLWITSIRAVFTGNRKTVELLYTRLANLNVFNDGISFNMTNRQSVPLFKVPNGQVIAAIVNASAQRAI